MDDDSEKNKAKETKKYVIKKRLKLNDYEDCLLNTNIIVQSKQRFKSNYHNVCTEQTFGKITTY